MKHQEPLLQILYYPDHARSSGIRVYPDGQFRYKNDDQPWQDVWTFTTEEMAELRIAISDSAFLELPAAIEPDSSITEGTLTIWTVHDSGKKHRVRLAPGAHDVRLEALFHAFTRLRRHAPERSDWRIRLPDGGTQCFTVLGSACAIPELYALYTAIFRTGEPENRQHGPGSGLLVDVKWYSATGIQETAVYDDGLFTHCCDSGIEQETFHPPAHVRRIKEIIAGLDWAKLKGQVDSTHS